MAKFKPQYLRLIFIDRKIRDAERTGNLPNCSSLAQEYETSSKTIQRDIEFLRYQMEAPIEYDPVRHGYYYSEPNFILPALRIAESDVFAIFLADKVLKQYENTPLYDKLSTVFNKIEQFLPEQVTIHSSFLERRLSVFQEPAPSIESEIWEEVFKSLRLGHSLDILYQLPSRDHPYQNRVDPYHVVGYKGDWYIIGHCHHKGALRIFNFSRLKKARVSKTPFQIPADFDFEAMWRNHFGIMAGENEVEVKIRFARDQAPYVKERTWHPAQQFEETADGAMIMTLKTRHLFEVKRWILSWGAAATAIEPAELVESLRAETQAMTGNYDA